MQLSSPPRTFPAPTRRLAVQSRHLTALYYKLKRKRKHPSHSHGLKFARSHDESSTTSNSSQAALGVYFLHSLRLPFPLLPGTYLPPSTSPSWTIPGRYLPSMKHRLQILPPPPSFPHFPPTWLINRTGQAIGNRPDCPAQPHPPKKKMTA